MDLSKAFDALNHDLLSAKLHACGFDRDSLKVRHSNLSNRYQRTKINKIFSSRSKIVFEVLLMNIFIESQFGYYQLTWMSRGRKNKTRINHVHERGLRIFYRNNSLCFDQLLQIDKSYNIHHKNIQTLATELYKVKNNLSNQIMQEIFKKCQNVDYNLRFQTDFVLPGVNTTYFGLRSLRYFSSKICNVIPDEIKNSLSLYEFTINIREWEPSGCHCKLCRST